MKKVPIYSTKMLSEWYHSDVEFDFTTKASNENLVNLSETEIFTSRYYSHSDGLNFPYKKQLTTHSDIHVRESVASALLSANKKLRNIGLELVVLDGYRDLILQKTIWNYFKKEVSDRNPSLSKSEVIRKTSVYCWNPETWDEMNAATWPVHMTGGSVDVTLRKLSNCEALYMGTIFDESSPLAHTDAYEKILHSVQNESCLTTSEKAALLARRILYNTMSEVGFDSYWGEWWHYDMGTQLSARSKSVKGQQSISFYPVVGAEFYSQK